MIFHSVPITTVPQTHNKFKVSGYMNRGKLSSLEVFVSLLTGDTPKRKLEATPKEKGIQGSLIIEKHFSFKVFHRVHLHVFLPLLQREQLSCLPACFLIHL